MTAFDVMAATCAELSARLGVPCASEVPSPRPDEFATVERTGGGYSLARDEPSLAVQLWAETDAAAYTLALAAREVLRNMRETVPQVCRVEVGSIYSFPDPDSRSRRYQIDAYMTTRP